MVKAASAREKFSDVLTESAVTTSDQMLAKAKSHLMRLKGLDPSWMLEHSCVLLICSGEEAAARMLELVCACLPSAERPTVTVQESVRSLDQLTKEKHFVMTPEGIQRQVHIALGIVKTLEGDGAPSAKRATTSAAMTRTVLQRAAFSCSSNRVESHCAARPCITKHHRADRNGEGEKDEG